MTPTKFMKLELHSEDEIVVTEKFTNYEAKSRYGIITEIQDNWVEDVKERLGLNGQFKSVLYFY